MSGLALPSGPSSSKTGFKTPAPSSSQGGSSQKPNTQQRDGEVQSVPEITAVQGLVPTLQCVGLL